MSSIPKNLSGPIIIKEKATIPQLLEMEGVKTKERLRLSCTEYSVRCRPIMPVDDGILGLRRGVVLVDSDGEVLNCRLNDPYFAEVLDAALFFEESITVTVAPPY